VYLFTRRKWGNSLGAALRPLENYLYRPAEPVQTDRRLNANLSPLAIAIAEEETVDTIVLDSPSVRLALFDGFAYCSAEICTDEQART
jgi:hypothetical protein